EPLLYEPLPELIEACRKYGLYCILSTNGSLLDPEKTDWFIQLGVDEIHLPLESVNPATFDRIRGKEDSFEHNWGLIDHISTKYPDSRKLVFQTAILRQNLEEIMPTLGWVINFNYAKINFSPLLPPLLSQEEDRSWLEKHWPENKEELSMLFEFILRTKDEFQDSICNSREQIKGMKRYYLGSCPENSQGIITKNMLLIDSQGSVSDTKGTVLGNISGESILKMIDIENNR
ncbi:radical SAM protein, partial [Candidatus Woesearchaeota archaeon]|nr:radical SAM protein [Candidatus Woesearchaeota archaeon]